MRLIILGLALLAAFAAPAFAARMEGIVAVVNQDAISESDLADRLKLVMASSGMPDNADLRDKLRPQILNVLIEEKLKLQEAERLELEIAQADVEEGFATIAAQNNISADQFRTMLRRSGVSPETLEDQVRAQIAWSMVIQKKLRPQIAIADNEIDAVLARLQADIGKSEYLVSEIFLPVDSPADEGDVKTLADKLARQLGEGRVPFQKLAAQFSQAPGASKGGDMGWVQDGQLPEELNAMLHRMKEEEMSQPVRTLSGYHILFLRKKRGISEDTMPSREGVMQRLGLERLDRMQRRYLMDLKTEAFIENRA